MVKPKTRPKKTPPADDDAEPTPFVVPTSAALLNECKTNYGVNDRYFEPPLPPADARRHRVDPGRARFLAGDRSPRLPAIGRTRKSPAPIEAKPDRLSISPRPSARA